MNDLLHRVVWTAVETACGALVATSLLDLDRQALAVVVATTVAAVLTVVKERARSELDGRRSVDLEERLR